MKFIQKLIFKPIMMRGLSFNDKPPFEDVFFKRINAR